MPAAADDRAIGGDPSDAPGLYAHLLCTFGGPLSSARLLVRAVESDDVDDMFAYQSREDVCAYNIGFEPRRRDEVVEVVAGYVEGRRLAEQGDFLKLVIERVANPGHVIGDIFFELRNVEQATAEIGWTCHPDHHGHGYMTEALTAFLAFAFADLHVHRITADIDSRNASSLALASRLGMREEGCFVAAKWSRGAWRDMVQCALLDAEWSAADRPMSDGAPLRRRLFGAYP